MLRFSYKRSMESFQQAISYAHSNKAPKELQETKNNIMILVELTNIYPTTSVPQLELAFSSH
jgi:hypothetical protein